MRIFGLWQEYGFEKARAVASAVLICALALIVALHVEQVSVEQVSAHEVVSLPGQSNKGSIDVQGPGR
jgi:hypothetical protein